MNTDIKDKLAAEFTAANFFEKIPAELHGFTLKKILADNSKKILTDDGEKILEDGDKFIYFTYENISTHRSFTAYFHAETMEYKARVKIGLTEFCLTNFFTDNFERFIQNLNAEMSDALKNLAEPADAESDILIADKKFSAWSYGQSLPQSIGDFELFITTKNPVKITNGSYIIINYGNFEKNCDFSIVYNVYKDNFSGESQVGGVNHPSYIFDAKDLKMLEIILQQNLEKTLNNLNSSVIS